MAGRADLGHDARSPTTPDPAFASRLYRWMPIPLGLAVFFAQAGLGVVLFAIFQEYVPNGLHAGTAWGGYLLSAYGAARFASEGPTGAIADRMARRHVLLFSFLFLIPGIAAMSATENRVALLACAIVTGFGTAFLWPATYAMSADIYPPARRGMVIGFLNVAQLVGFGIGALVGALLVEEHSAVVFLIAILAVGLGAVPAILGVPRYALPTAIVEADAVRPRLRDVWTAQLATVSALVFATTATVAMIVPAIRPYGKEELGISISTTTLLLIPAVAIGAALYVPAGHLADRYGRALPIIIGQVLLVAGMLGVAETRSIPVAMIAAVFIFGGNVFSVPAVNAAIMDLAPASHRGTVIGLTVALSGLGIAMGPGLGGFLASVLSPAAVFRIGAVTAFATLIAAVLYLRHYREAASRPQPVVVADRA
jgi:MFS family permease